MVQVGNDSAAECRDQIGQIRALRDGSDKARRWVTGAKQYRDAPVVGHDEIDFSIAIDISRDHLARIYQIKNTVVVRQGQRANRVPRVNRQTARLVIVVFNDSQIRIAIVVEVSRNGGIRRADAATDVCWLQNGWRKNVGCCSRKGKR